MSTIEVIGTVATANEIDAFAGRLVPATRRGILDAAYGHREYMVGRFLSGSPLRRRSGQLASNLHVVEAPSLEPGEIRVVTGTDTPYARAQNYGFHGPVWVRQHVRRGKRRRRERKPRRRSGLDPNKRRKELLYRGEKRAQAAERQRREKDSQAAHGMTLRRQQAGARAARRARGLQGGIEATVSPALAREAADIGGGATVVRAHGRFMKLRGHLFVERSLVEYAERALEIVQIRVREAMGRLA